MSIFDLSNRTAVITGGNGGIGLGIAQALAAAGCNVSIWGRNADKNKNAAASMSGAKGKVDTQVCDVTDVTSVKAAMDATLKNSAVSMAVSPMPASAAADVTPSSTARKSNGATCSPPISMAYSMCFRRPPAT